ncbi:MAG TPA: hypothetical protein VGP94_10835, partial [Tepidisphaeraceae bacterium]|nr:hypothetical protein [Tepidisphaeraceae bacterium]
MIRPKLFDDTIFKSAARPGMSENFCQHPIRLLGTFQLGRARSAGGTMLLKCASLGAFQPAAQIGRDALDKLTMS